MSSESELVLAVWDAVRDNLPYTKRSDIAKDVLYAFAEWFDAEELAPIVDEDPDLRDAFEEVYPPIEDEETDEDE
jgi:hypothetical protein